MSMYRQMGQLLEVLHKLKISWKIKSNVEAKVVVLTSPRLKVIRLAWCPCANGLPHCKSSFFNTFVRIRAGERILASPNGANAKVRLRQIAQGTHQVAKTQGRFLALDLHLLFIGFWKCGPARTCHAVSSRLRWY